VAKKDKNSNGKAAVSTLGARLKAGSGAKPQAPQQRGQGKALVSDAEASLSKEGAESLDSIKALLGAKKNNKTTALEKADLAAAKPEPVKEGKKLVDGSDAVAILASMKNSRSSKVEGKAPSSEDKEKKIEAGRAKDKAPASDGTEVKLGVTDLRTAHKAKPEAAVEATAGAATGPGRPGQDKPLRELSLDLDPSKGIGNARLGEGLGQAPDASFSATQAAPGRDFSSVLAEQLKAGWNNDIVQNAHLILKDGDQGTIRLRLHPDSLGSVKIELQLSDNNISGKIIVESQEAKSAFERNMAQLQDAFKQGGFESARLEVQVGSGNSGAAGGKGQDGPVPYWSERRGLDSLAAAVPELGQEGYRAKAQGAVNLFA